MRRQRWEYCVYAGRYSHGEEVGGLDEDQAEGENLVHFYSDGKEADFDGPAEAFKALGEAGWELVSSVVVNYRNERDPNEQVVKHLFKRPLSG